MAEMIHDASRSSPQLTTCDDPMRVPEVSRA